MSKYKRIIGSRAIVLETTTNKGGTTINSGEAVTIKGSYRGYEIETDDGRLITRVPKDDIRIIRTDLRKQ